MITKRSTGFFIKREFCERIVFKKSWYASRYELEKQESVEQH